MTVTHETMVLGVEALPPGGRLDEFFAAYAALTARAAHLYFVARHVRGENPNDLKSGMSRRLGLTHRQFSSVAFLVDGKAKAVREGMKVRIEDLVHRIAAAEIADWRKRIAAEKKKDAAHRDWRGRCKTALETGRKPPTRPKSLRGFEPGPSALLRADLKARIHQKKRYVKRLSDRWETLKKDLEAGRVRLCFGSRKLFRAQHHLAVNGFRDHAAWLAQWRSRRVSEIFCIGSKDEERGSQTAAWLGDRRLRLRVPPALEAKYGRYVVLLLKAFRRQGVQDQVDRIAGTAARRDGQGKLLASAQGLAWRLTRRKTQRGVTWVAQVTFDEAVPAVVSDRRLGAWGLDFNPDHAAMTRIDRFGNQIERATYPLDLQGKSRDQIAAILGDAAKWVVALCLRDGVPLCAELLDFRAKKARLRERGARYARMLSQFAYATFHELTDRRGKACGVEVRRVNPAYTSVLGAAKFARGYALSVHHAAACAIARRGLGFSERLARRTTGPIREAGGSLPSGSAFPLPARTRGKHVWSDWRRFSNLLRQARVRAFTAVDEAGGRRRKRRSDPRGNGAWGQLRRGASPGTTAMRERSRRQPAKPFRWRAVVPSAPATARFVKGW